MKHSYIVSEKYFVTPDTFLLHLQPYEEEPLFAFDPGQYVNLYNPQSTQPEEAHPYSIASSPLETEYLEFCIKIYGDWTAELSHVKVGDTVDVEGPHGEFIWKPNEKNCVFLVGGIGIAAFMSMLRFMQDIKSDTTITLLYGNRTEETIMYKEELGEMVKDLHQGSKVIHILSEVEKKSHWKGYIGFITKEIIEKEVDLKSQPIFFIVGPPVFIELMNKLLAQLHIDSSYIKQEKL